MNTPTTTFWWHLLATLAVEIGGLAVLAVAAQRLVRSAFWRRAVWQMAIVCMVAATVSEWTGVGRALADYLAPRQPTMETPAVAIIDPAPSGSFVAVPSVASPSPTPARRTRAVWWPGLIGLAGTALLLARTVLAQGFLCALRLGRYDIEDGALLERAEGLAARLGLRRKVCLRRMPALMSPMAFGLWQPCIGLPAQFETRFTASEQDAVLAHELAHLAARDPVWFLLADLAVAVLWWHPASWWARQRLHVLSEQAADEAAVRAGRTEGPGAMPGRVGKEMANMGAWGWVGINGGGFRSNLGRGSKGCLNCPQNSPRPCSDAARAGPKSPRC